VRKLGCGGNLGITTTTIHHHARHSRHRTNLVLQAKENCERLDYIITTFDSSVDGQVAPQRDITSLVSRFEPFTRFLYVEEEIRFRS
jgi:hypothetical protein